MLKNLTGNDLFAAILMTHQVDPRPVILVESPEDCGMIDPHLNETSLSTVPGYGKTSVLEVANLSIENRVSYILPVVDADFDRQLASVAALPGNVELSEFYDLDCDAIFQPGNRINALLSNFANKTIMGSYLREQKLDALGILVEIAKVIGVLRFCSMRDGLGLNLSRFPVNGLIDAYENDTLIEEIISRADARSTGHTIISVETLSREIQSIPDVRHYCNGHDLIAILASLIRDRWAGARIKAGYLASALRAAVPCVSWEAMRLKQAIETWANGLGAHTIWSCPIH